MSDITPESLDAMADYAMRDTPRVASLVFNDDGTLAPEQLEGLPEELKAQVTSPEFIAAAREEIARRKRLANAFKPSQFRQFTPISRTIRHTPKGVSRRDARAMSRIARRVMKGAR
jgi:hypothetical protein